MARSIRVEFEGAVYHILARGNERQPIFRSDKDRQLFLQTLEQMIEQFGVILHVYCLMLNHYHLVLETPRGNLSQAMGWLQTTYTIRYNRRYQRSGHLFQGRFKAHLVEADSYARELVRYIHLNPVRHRDKKAKIPPERKKEIDAYSWSSHLDYAGRRKKPDWLNLDWLSYWGRRGAEAQKRYREEIGLSFGKPVARLWEQLQGGLVLGTETLWQKATELIANKNGQEESRWAERHRAREIQDRIKELEKHEADPRIKIWIRVRLGGQRLVEIAREFGYRDGSGALYAIKRVEQLANEDRKIKEKLNQLKKRLSRFKS